MIRTMTSSNTGSGRKAWCGHCKRDSDAVSHGAFTSCLFCGKVLHDICVMDKVPILSRVLKKKKNNTRAKNKLAHNVSVGFKSTAWCSHCKRDDSNAFWHDFCASCLQCGKVLIHAPCLSRLKKKTKDKATSKVDLDDSCDCESSSMSYEASTAASTFFSE